MFPKGRITLGKKKKSGKWEWNKHKDRRKKNMKAGQECKDSIRGSACVKRGMEGGKKGSRGEKDTGRLGFNVQW
jgi:hypothetical protein